MNVENLNAPKAISDRLQPATIIRFLRKVRMFTDVAGETHWLWSGCRDKKGYGQFRMNSRAHWAHRLSYATFVGPIPDGMTVNHKRECLIPRCVCPDHLELLTIAENTAEGNRRRRVENGGGQREVGE